MDERAIPVLETERLRLRAFRTSDFEDYAALCTDPEVARYLTVCFTRELAWRNLAFAMGHWRMRGFGLWAVEEKTTGAFVGRTGFWEPDGWPGCELVWALMPRFWGRGYATEAGRAALSYAFTVMNKEHVISLIHPDNSASIRVAERLGETLRGRTGFLGNDHLVYGVDRGPASPTSRIDAACKR